MYGHKWVDIATPSEESKNGTSEPEVKKPSFSFGKTDEKKDETPKPSFSFGATSYGFSSNLRYRTRSIARSRFRRVLIFWSYNDLGINVNPEKVQKRKTMKRQSRYFLSVKLKQKRRKRKIHQNFHSVREALTSPKKLHQNLVLVLNLTIRRMSLPNPLVDFLPI